MAVYDTTYVSTAYTVGLYPSGAAIGIRAYEIKFATFPALRENG